MANKEKGEYILRSPEGTPYTLRLTTNAACEMEDVSKGRTLTEVQDGVIKGRIKDVRLLMWASLREHHPELATEDPDSLKTIGKWIDQMGGVDGINTQMVEFMTLNADTGQTPEELAEQQESAKNGKRTRPRPAQASTGASSTSTRSASA